MPLPSPAPALSEPFWPRGWFSGRGGRRRRQAEGGSRRAPLVQTTCPGCQLPQAWRFPPPGRWQRAAAGGGAVVGPQAAPGELRPELLGWPSNNNTQSGALVAGAGCPVAGCTERPTRGLLPAWANKCRGKGSRQEEEGVGERHPPFSSRCQGPFPTPWPLPTSPPDTEPTRESQKRDGRASEGGGLARKEESSRRGNALWSVKLQPVVLHIVPEALQKPSSSSSSSVTAGAEQ